MPSKPQLDSQSIPPSDEPESSKERTPQPQATCVLSRNGTHSPSRHDWVAQSRMMSASCLHKASIAVQLCCWAGKPTLPPAVGPSPVPLRSPSSVLVAQSCLTLCIPMDCGPPGSSVLGIFQAGILERVAIRTPGDLPHPGIEPSSRVSPALAFPFTTSAT